MREKEPFIRNINEIITPIYKASIGLGAIVFAVYCSSIDFFPKGMSIADAIFFAFIMLGLTFILLSGITLGYLSTVFLIPLIARLYQYFRKNEKSQPFGPNKIYDTPGIVTTLISIFTAFILIMTVIQIITGGMSYDEKEKYLRIILSFSIGGFLFANILHIINLDDAGNPIPILKDKSNIIIFILIMTIPIATSGIKNISHITFSLFGINSHNTSILLQNESRSQIQNISKIYGIKIPTCEHNKELVTIENVDILWSKIGSISLININGANNKGEPSSFEVEINDSDMKILRIGKGSNLTKCKQEILE